MKRTIACLASLLLMVSVFAASIAFEVNVAPVSAHSGDVLSAWAAVVPTINGVISSGEWDDADSVSFLLEYSDLLPETSVHEARMYVKNDETYLYLAVLVEWDDYNANDFGNWWFENDHDGVIEVGDDGLSVRSDGLSTDRYRPRAVEGWWYSDTSENGTNDIVGAASHTNPTGVGDYTFEYRHPLDTADDAHDFSLKPGDTVGFQFCYADGGEGGGSDEWPGLPDYGDIIIASKDIAFLAAYSTNVPVIDGSLTGLEWNDANIYNVSLSGTVPALLYFKHDGTNIYIGLKVVAEDHNFDQFLVFFDEGDDGGYGSGTRDGVLTSNQEDLKACFSPPISGNEIEDGCYKDGTWFGYWGGDFSADCGFVVDHWQVEFSIPFTGNDGATDDVSDLVCTVADTIGIKIQYFTQPGANNYFYPAGNQYQIGTYATLSFEPAISEVFSAWTSVKPNIDGLIDKREWAAADTARYETTGGIEGVCYVMNDASNLYIAIITTDSTLSEDTEGTDAVALYFDNDNDGMGPEKGDDIIGWSGYLHEHFRDGFSLGTYSWYRDTDYDGTSDGESEAQNINKMYNHFEIAHPLNSRDDAHDFSLRLGDTVGFALRLAVNGLDKGWWPSSDLAVWHDIIIASPPVHDVAVISLGVYPTYVRQGDPVLIGGTVENQGEYTETFDVTFYATLKLWFPPYQISIPIQTLTVTNLAPGARKGLLLIWNTVGFVLGKYTIKAYAHPVPGETDTTDNLLVDGTVQVYKGIGYFIIVAGRLRTGNHPEGDKQAQINYGCNKVFQILRNVDYSGDRIYYLNPWSPQDVDGDGLNDIDASSSSANLQWAIETWASSRVGPSEPLFLYLFDHGGTNSFCIDASSTSNPPPPPYPPPPGDRLSSTQLASWLNNLEEATNAPIHVIYTACHSGSFIDELSSTGRVTVTSCRGFESCSLAPDGNWEAFSQPFWLQIESGHSVGWSFDSACATIVAQGYLYKPQLDDNGDDIGHTAPLPNGGDGFVADTLYVGSCEWTFPWISYVVEKQFFRWPPPTTVTLWATVENETPLVHVRAWMVPPGWQPPPTDEVLIDPGFECFEMADPDHDGTWTVSIPAVNFTNHAIGPSDFKFIITAEEEKGNTAIPLATGVQFTKTGLPPEDSTPPGVRIERPIDMRVVHGKIIINGTAMDDVCLERVELVVDGKLYQTTSVEATQIRSSTSNSFFELSLDTTTISNGPINILVKAFDTSGNSGYQTLTLLVNNFVHDIAVTDVTPYKTIVGQGLTLNIDVTVANHGSYPETFDVTAYADKFLIQTQTVTGLGPNEQETITFKWNTADYDKGNYTIRAYAGPIEGETDTLDNSYVNGGVLVTIAGDIDGDFDVDYRDLFILARAYGSSRGDPEYVPNADLDCNGKIDYKDLFILARNYGKKDP